MPTDRKPGDIARRLTQLGAKSVLTDAQLAEPHSILEAFPNPSPNRDYTIQFVFPEFTSVCPVTGQPDFATITVRYVPDRLCVEMKSLKLYFFSYRNKGIFYEAVTNAILDDLVAVLKPRRLTVVGDFAVRGGTAGTITVEYDSSKGNHEGAKREDGPERKGGYEEDVRAGARTFVTS